ncbi:MAG: DNA gyrase subunit A [Anaerolineae bacterium]|nr:DNA gyrase subunit A [Anaerolineae bacterium]
MEVGIVRQVDIDQQMQEAYLDYAMSVIVSRALPDVRDGLKPVHRRILYAMHDMGLRPTQPYKKSARIVGEVLGKYHPHGDAAVYEAMVRMAQDFSMRAPLVDGQGNFGSIDGDPPAAMRYTEARQFPLTLEMMADIEKDTVDFVDNFDSSLVEPKILPTRLPNFLVNGAAGIAVGMATSVPPHNLDEVCDALIFILDRMMRNKDVTIDELLKYIKGPDFPTGGVIYRYASKNGADEESDLIRSAYATGRGRITVQAKVHVEEMSRNRNRLVITELPYQTNKASLAEKIADLARDGKIEGLTDLRDESDRQGMRLVIELTRTVEPMAVLKQLFKMTALQITFSINMLALVDGEPRLLPLKRSLQLFIEHRQEIITRRSQYELNQAKNRAHILEGLRVALDNLDEVIQTIRSSRTVDTAKANLRKKFKLSEIQVSAILDMPLRRLAALERKKIETEYKEVLQCIKYLEKLLKTPKQILGVIKEELADLKTQYGTPRRTVIIDQETNGDKLVTAGDLLPDEEVVVCISQSGQICRWPAGNGLEPARGRQKDPLVVATPAHTRDTLYLFTEDGRAVIIPMHQIPQGQTPGEGANVGEFSSGALKPVVAGLALPHTDEPEGYLFLVSRLGRVKRITLSDLVAVRGNEAIVMGLEKGDTLLMAFSTGGKDEVMLASAKGQAIRFAEEEVRPMGLPATGVWGMKLAKGDELAGAGPVKPRGDLIVITQQGLGKRMALSQYPTQGRYGQGVIAMSLTKAAGPIAVAATANASDRVMMISQKGNNKTIYAKALPKLNRNQKGQELMAIRGKDQMARLVVLTQ